MGKYAAQTQVSTDQSRMEIERTLLRYGADQFGYGWEGNRATIAFRAHGRFIRFTIELPRRDAPEFTQHSRGQRTETAAYAAWEQACRQKWRALGLVVKAKLEAVESGISEFEDEFLAFIVLPDGSTAGQWLRPQIEASYRSGGMPAALRELGTGA